MRLLPSSVLLVACAGAPPRRVEPACNADAKIVLAGQDDVSAAAGCLTIQSLAIRTGVPLDLTPLQKLHVILGDLRVGPTVAFDDLRLPELHSAGAITIAGNGDLHGVFLPKLVSARSVTIESDVALTTILMPALHKVGDALTIRGNADLGLVELSSLQTVGGELTVADNPKLTLLELGKLERVQAVRVENNGELDTNVVEAVRSKAAP